MSHAIFVFLAAVANAQAPAGDLVDEARAFLGALSEELRAEAQIPFNDDARLDWHYVPRERPGLSLKKMSPEQREKALSLMRAALSPKGYEITETIRKLDIVLREMGGGPSRDPEFYDVAVFGEPSTDAPWGLRYEGHHISLNWTFADGKAIASTPQFLGADPADVAEGEFKGTRALGATEDLGRSLVMSLSEEQRAKGVLDATAPPEILTGAAREAAILEDKGIAYAELNADQQGLLLEIVREYASVQPDALAKERFEKIQAGGIEKLKFAWMGGLEKGEGHYYRIQGPSFVIEYDNTQNNANHVHTVWRDFNGDFGRDLLRDHYHDHPAPHQH
ncbi:MAG: DUF3500 domain-containing protein [FCB group bacterium]|jgi:hypothetical protein|nr:DUF3500 domain-containing protein [FCB group bacterium]